MPCQVRRDSARRASEVTSTATNSQRPSTPRAMAAGFQPEVPGTTVAIQSMSTAESATAATMCSPRAASPTPPR